MCSRIKGKGIHRGGIVQCQRKDKDNTHDLEIDNFEVLAEVIVVMEEA